MHDVLQWIALFGMAGIGVLFLVEVRKWRQLGSVMNRGQRILRVLLVVFVEVLFAMMIVGPAVTSRKDPLTSLLYWMVCVIVGLVVVVLALFDWYMIARQYAKLNRQMFRDLRGDGRHED